MQGKNLNWELAGHGVHLGNPLLLKLNIKYWFAKLLHKNFLDLWRITMKPRICMSLWNSSHWGMERFLAFQSNAYHSQMPHIGFFHLNITSEFKEFKILIQVNFLGQSSGGRKSKRIMIYNYYSVKSLKPKTKFLQFCISSWYLNYFKKFFGWLFN